MITINRKFKQNRIALLIAAILLSLNIGMGQDEFLSQLIKNDYNNQSESSLLRVKYDYKLNVESLKEAIEPEAEIENWMSDINLWSSEEIEEEAEIENWMLQTDLWKSSLTENELEIEGWMLNSNLWL